MKYRFIAILGALCVACVSAAVAQTVADPVDDKEMNAQITRQGGELIAAGKTTPAKVLCEQLKRESCMLPDMPSSARRVMTPARCFLARRDQVIVIGGLYKCLKCTNWHASMASGFPIAGTDVFVTNHHVFMDTNAVGFVAMTRQGKVQPVMEILAASKQDDIAIIRIPGLGLKPVALRPDAAVGEPVTLISHPATHFFAYSDGMIARYAWGAESSKQKRLLMEITTDFAKGSSGAPILDQYGNAVGMVAATQAVLYDPHKSESFQMVFKQCVPAIHIQALVKPATR